MSKIKTREKTRDIKLLDKSAVVNQRMKSALIRSKNRADDLVDNRQDTPGEYASDQLEAGLGNLLHDTGTVGISGAKTAVRKSREALLCQRSKKAAEPGQTGTAADKPFPPSQPHTTSTFSGRPNPPTSSPAASAGDGPVFRAREDLTVERGRQFAKQQAARHSKITGQVRSRLVRQERPIVNQNGTLSPSGHASPSERTESAAAHISATIKRPARQIRRTGQSVSRAVNSPARQGIKTARQLSKAHPGTK